MGWFDRHQLRVYFGLAFFLSWLPWPLVLLNPDSSPLVPFGPLVAAVVTVLLVGGVRHLRPLLAQLGRWRVRPHWYLLALAGPLAIFGLAAALTIATGAAADIVPRVDPIQLVVTLATTLVLVGLFEEVGWRGYALPQLQQRMGSLPAALVLGLIWALWHLPELISDSSGQRPAAPFAIMVLAQSVLLTWLYLRTAGSLPIVIVAHAAIDSIARNVLPWFVTDGYVLMWWFVAGLWTMAAVAIIILGGFRLATPSTPKDTP